MTRNDKVVNYVIEKINHEFQKDIDLLLCYGSYINGTANDKSDVDMYFIPRNNRGYELGETFILNGIGYDIFGMSWERVESIAKFHENISPLVGDVRILYSYSDHEINKFKQLQQHMQECLSDKNYMCDRACDRVKEAISFYNNMTPESSIGRIRFRAGYILMLLAEAVAYMNQTYFHKGLKTQFTDLKELEKQPTEFTLLYHDTIIQNNIDQIKEKCEKIIKSTIEFLGMDHEITLLQTNKNFHTEDNGTSEQKIEKAIDYIDYNDYAHWYEELASTFNKIYICVEKKDYVLAFISACCLQNSLESYLNVELKATDLLSEFKYDDLEKLASMAHKIETSCINEIEMNHVKIRKVSAVDELKY